METRVTATFPFRPSLHIAFQNKLSKIV